MWLFGSRACVGLHRHRRGTCRCCLSSFILKFFYFRLFVLNYICVCNVGIVGIWEFDGILSFFIITLVISPIDVDNLFYSNGFLFKRINLFSVVF